MERSHYAVSKGMQSVCKLLWHKLRMSGLVRYVEVHLEQGPVLQDRGAALAPVAAIAGQSRLALTLHGTQVLPPLSRAAASPVHAVVQALLAKLGLVKDSAGCKFLFTLVQDPSGFDPLENLASFGVKVKIVMHHHSSKRIQHMQNYSHFCLTLLTAHDSISSQNVIRADCSARKEVCHGSCFHGAEE